MCLLERCGVSQEDLDGVIVGPSTDNKIERFWRDVREKVVDNIKPTLRALYEEGRYDPTSQDDRDILSGVFIPIIQKELDRFMEYHNSKRLDILDYMAHNALFWIPYIEF